GDDSYSLQKLEEGAPYIAKVYYKGEQLTGSELEKVSLKWEPKSSNAEIKKEFAKDHWKLSLHYKDPVAPEKTECGECTVSIHAFYSAQGSNEAQAQSPLTYNIKDNFSPVQIELIVPQDYIVIKDLNKSKPITAKLSINGRPLTAEEFAATTITVDCGDIKHTVTPKAEDSSCLIKLLPTDGIGEGDYSIKLNAKIVDQFGRAKDSQKSTVISLGYISILLKWLIGILILLIIIIIIWSIAHIRVLPKHMHTTRKLSSMNFDGDDVTQSTNFLAEIKKKSAKVQGQYAGKKFGVSMDVKPGKESYLYKSNKRRSAEVKVNSVRKFGAAKIQEAMIGSAKYVADESGGKLVPALPNQKPFSLTNGTMIKFSGTIQDAGIDKDFEVTSNLNFKKK
ncbi:MAG: hypothetical protein J6J72_04480, partial [Tyzzerella sp.]|nr:hypothetical protein [Tyzzerella sp.]